MLLDWETQKLLDDVDAGDCVEVTYHDENERLRMAIGKFSRLEKDSIGEWALFLKNRWVGIRIIDVLRIERVK
jgi:hypothetical protein